MRVPTCSALSLAQGESVAGTASQVTRWLLIEDPGPWGYDALAENKIPAPLLDELRSWARTVRARVILIRRRPRELQDARRIFLVNSTRGDEWISAFNSDDTEGLVAMERTGFGPHPAGEPVDSLYLVCTHGKHDQCCSINGNPVAGELCAQFGDSAWECSHIGGDRFAANVVCLPGGAYFGRVDAAEAQSLIEDYETGILDLDRFRGWSRLPFAAQAAEIEVRRRLGLTKIADLTTEGWTRTGDRSFVVEMSAPTGLVTATVEVTNSEDTYFLTCRSAQPDRPLRFEVTTSVGGSSDG